MRPVVVTASALVLYTSISQSFWMMRSDQTLSQTNVQVPFNHPSLQRPFIFLHVPGSGGVSFRQAINQDATRMHANKFLPCYQGLKCAINTEQEFNRTNIIQTSFASELSILQREMRCATVIAGHFKVQTLTYQKILHL